MQGDAVFTGGEPQAVFLAGDGIVAAGVIVQAELLIFLPPVTAFRVRPEELGVAVRLLLAEERS